LSTSLSPSTFGSSVFVAPIFRATSRRAPIGSIAIIFDAPEMRAPCTALNPNGPQPTTATIEPGAMAARVCDVVVPSPATLTQLQTMPRSSAAALVKTGTTHSSNVTM